MNKYKGHVSIEWVIVMLVMVLVLFTPIPGLNQSVVGMMMESIRGFNEHSSFVYSLP